MNNDNMHFRLALLIEQKANRTGDKAINVWHVM